ncbi:hypothetical protein [Enterococcus rivorum]|uniref:Type VII secretion effector n=1 Tax=Enterococcus rivorum TaxID=762845 RepID=A0A1E5KWC3_9ENTE|nr:hypothetical protein [Enterococcus rivorum]MBP2100072.1 hypothetical protein [Enterococcus rivorum]OEH82118.1 hypothetical protein BCR26_14365 [Enterococcus rivorum]
MGTIASDIGTATAAVGGLQSVSVNKGQQVTLGTSTVASMKAGAELSNQLLSNLSDLVECVKEQSQSFPKIAEMIAIEDSKINF